MPKIKLLKPPARKRKVSFTVEAPARISDRDIKSLLRFMFAEDCQAFHECRVKVTFIKIEPL